MSSSVVTVAHFIDQYIPVTENWIAPVVRGAAGVRSSVLSVRRPVNVDQFPCGHIEALETLPPETLLEEARLLQRHGHIRHFRTAATRHGAEVIHAHFGDLGVRAIGLSRRLRVPLVTSFYGYDLSKLPRHPVWATAYQALFAHGDTFIVEGSHARRCLVELGCPEERVQVVHFGIDASARFVPRRLDAGGPLRVLLPARLVAKKGTTLALEGLARFRALRPDLPLAITLVGDGPERDNVFAAVKRLGLDSVVHAVPFWTHDEFVRRLADFHVVLQHSVTAPDGDHEGGAPVSLLEAQASGALVVATRHADIPEYVRDGQSGILVAERDVDGCAQALVALVERADSWPDMGRAGHDHVRAHYTAAAELNQLKAIYQDAVARPRQRSQRRRVGVAERWPDLLWLGAFFHNRGYVDDAAPIFEHIVRLDPANTDARFKLAVSVVRQAGSRKDPGVGPTVAAQVPTMDPAAALALAREAAASPEQQDVADAIADALLDGDPRFTPALYLKAGLAVAAGRRSQASAHYRRIVETSTDPLFVGGAHFHLGECLLHEGRATEARSAYRACLREIPSHRKAVARLLSLTGAPISS